jgi:hypothetical protein
LVGEVTVKTSLHKHQEVRKHLTSEEADMRYMVKCTAKLKIKGLSLMLRVHKRRNEIKISIE